MSYKQQGAAQGPHSFHWYRLTQHVFADRVESEPGDRLQGNNCGNKKRECAQGAKQGKMKNKGNFCVNIIVMVCLSCGRAERTIPFPNFLQLAHENKTNHLF